MRAWKKPQYSPSCAGRRRFPLHRRANDSRRQPGSDRQEACLCLLIKPGHGGFSASPDLVVIVVFVSPAEELAPDRQPQRSGSHGRRSDSRRYVSQASLLFSPSARIAGQRQDFSCSPPPSDLLMIWGTAFDSSAKQAPIFFLA
jgi:hypothetical protein